MTPEEWAQIKAVFDLAAELTASPAREHFTATACQGNVHLLAEAAVPGAARQDRIRLATSYLDYGYNQDDVANCRKALAIFSELAAATPQGQPAAACVQHCPGPRR